MYKQALQEYLDNEATPKELADKYNLDVDVLRGFIKQHQMVEEVKKMSGLYSLKENKSE